VPGRAQPGQYTLEVSLTENETGRPLRRMDQPGSSVPLGQIRISNR
jgi:hypothetical protein